MKALLILFLLILGAAAPPAAAPAGREGYIAGEGGVRLFYRIEGDGPETLVVVHGGPASSMESVRADMAPLARGRRVIYYDQRGNGRSQLVEDEEQLSIVHHIADLEAVRRHFGLERLTLLGNSWGGLLISAYAAAHPDRVERMVLDASAPPTRAQLDALSDEFGRRSRARFTPDQARRLQIQVQPDYWLNAADPLAVCREVLAGILKLYQHDPSAALPLHGDLCDGGVEAVRKQRMVQERIWRSLGDYDYRPAVRRVTAPVLVVYGESDAIPRQGAEDWARNFGNARLLVIANTGHLAHAEQPELFFAAVERFLSGGWPPAARRIATPPAPADGRVR